MRRNQLIFHIFHELLSLYVTRATGGRAHDDSLVAVIKDRPSSLMSSLLSHVFPVLLVWALFVCSVVTSLYFLFFVKFSNTWACCLAGLCVVSLMSRKRAFFHYCERSRVSNCSDHVPSSILETEAGLTLIHVYFSLPSAPPCPQCCLYALSLPRGASFMSSAIPVWTLGDMLFFCGSSKPHSFLFFSCLILLMHSHFFI